MDADGGHAEFSGRSRRREYWAFSLTSTVLALIMFALGYSVAGSVGAFVGAFLYMLVAIVPGFAVSVRRLHDQEKSGAFFLLNLVPYIGGFVFMIFTLVDGTAGTNKYGDDPKGRGAAYW